MHNVSDQPNATVMPTSNPTPSPSRPRFGVAPRFLIMAALLGGVWLATTVMGQPAFAWRSSFDDARAEAAERGVPILLDFWGAYCPPCRMLDIRIFADDQAAAAIAKHCVPFKVDVTHAGPTNDAAALATKFNVRFTPTVLLVDSETLELIAKAKREDLADVEAFGNFLRR